MNVLCLSHFKFTSEMIFEVVLTQYEFFNLPTFLCFNVDVHQRLEISKKMNIFHFAILNLYRLNVKIR